MSDLISKELWPEIKGHIDDLYHKDSVPHRLYRAMVELNYSLALSEARNKKLVEQRNRVIKNECLLYAELNDISDGGVDEMITDARYKFSLELAEVKP